VRSPQARQRCFRFFVAVAIGIGALTTLSHRQSSLNLAAVSPAARPLVSILGVLRRPQTAADKAAESKLLGHPDLSFVRLAAVTPWGEQVILAVRHARPLTP